LKWYEIDFNWYTIWIFKLLGLASGIHDGRPPARTQAGRPNSGVLDSATAMANVATMSRGPDDGTRVVTELQHSGETRFVT
jgi:hypothetical protein